MKAIKLLALFGLVTGYSNAATVTISSGLAAQGFTPYVSQSAVSNFFFSVGSYNTLTSTWTQFGSALADNGKVGGAGGISATSPTSLNNQIVDLFVGTAANIGTSAYWVVLRPSATTAKFPADVTGTGSVTVAASVPTGTSGWTIIAKGDETASFGGATPVVGGTILNLTTVPEPSAALLGALGALGLLRRRRI
jgi:MYXO-CTERM domain-containing protein